MHVANDNSSQLIFPDLTLAVGSTKTTLVKIARIVPRFASQDYCR